MQWNQIVRISKRYPVVSIIENDVAADYGNISFLTDAEQKPVAQTVYVGTVKELKTFFATVSNNNDNQRYSIITSDDAECSAVISEAPNICNVLVTAKKSHLNALYNDLLEMMDRERFVEYEFRQFIILMRQNPDINVIAQHISNMFYHSPVFIVSNTFSILGHSDQTNMYRELKDDINRKAIEMSALPRNENIYSLESPLTPDTTIISNPVAPFHSYHTAIAHNSLIVGYLDIFMDRSKRLSDLEISYQGFMADLIGNRLQKEGYYLSKYKTPLSSLLSFILSGESATEGELENRFMGFGYDIRKMKQLYVVQPNRKFLASNDLITLGNSLNSLIENSVFVEKENRLVFLTSFNQTSPFTRELTIRINKIISLNHLKMGISEPFENLQEAPLKLQEALASIATGQQFYPHLHAFFIEDLRLQFCATELLAHVAEPSLCYFSPVISLLEYDKKSGAELTKTLYYYLHFPKNIPLICDRLHIHKNTLYARLKKAATFFNAASMDEYLSIEKSAQVLVTLLMLQAQNRLYFTLESETHLQER